MEPTARAVAALFRDHATTDVCNALTTTLLAMCVSETQILKALVPLGASLVAALHVLQASRVQ